MVHPPFQKKQILNSSFFKNSVQLSPSFSRLLFPSVPVMLLNPRATSSLLLPNLSFDLILLSFETREWKLGLDHPWEWQQELLLSLDWKVNSLFSISSLGGSTEAKLWLERFERSEKVPGEAEMTRVRVGASLRVDAKNA